MLSGSVGVPSVPVYDYGELAIEIGFICGNRQVADDQMPRFQPLQFPAGRPQEDIFPVELDGRHLNG